MDLIEREEALRRLRKYAETHEVDLGAIAVVRLMPSAQPDDSRYWQGIIQGKVDMRTEILTKLKELVGEEVWSNI